jgi:hypothetical protein
MSLLRSPAVNFDEKWAGLRETIGRVVKLQPVEMAKWNDHYSYPSLLPYCLPQSLLLYIREC